MQIGKSLFETLLATSKSEDKMESGLLLNIVVRKCATILKLFASKDQSLLVWGNTFLILNFSFHIFNRVRGLNLKGNCFTSEGLDKDLHASSKPEDQVEGGLLLDVVVREGAAILELLASKDQSLLVWGNTFLILETKVWD